MAFQKGLGWVLELRARVGIPATLSELGLNGEDAVLVDELALAYISSLQTNTLPLGASDYARIYRSAVDGVLK